jgi:hypothetical protein
MKYRIIVIILVITSGFISCTKKDNSAFSDIPIVESYLRPGDFLNVRISRQIPFSTNVDYSSDDINALSVKIIHNNITYILTPVGEGRYTDSSLIITEGEKYDLLFNYNSKNVTAYTIIPTKPLNFVQSATSISLERMDSTSVPPTGPMPEPVVLTWDNDDASYFIVVIENLEATLDPIRDFGDREPPGNRFKKTPTTSSGLELRPQEFQYFGLHRIILHHVLPDYASLYEDKLTSSQNLTNPSTSIVNGYGIFTGLNADTLYLEVEEK